MVWDLIHPAKDKVTAKSCEQNSALLYCRKNREFID
jgi:hypothetical protein